MALYKTKTELVTDVLKSKNKLGADEPIDTYDQTYLEAAYDNKFAELKDDGLAYWAANDIPLEVFNSIRDLVWNEVRDAYGMPQSEADRHAIEDILRKRIRRHVSVKNSGHSVKAEYF